MGNLYKNIETLCESKKVSITIMCKESGASRGSLTDLKMGRISTLHPDTLQKIASYFGVSVDYLLTGEEQPQEQKPRRNLTEDEIRFALFDGKEITDAKWEEVKRFVKFVQNAD